MPAYSMYARPSENWMTSATLSMTNANATFPASNMKNLDPAVVAKATTTTTVITMTGSSVTIYAFAIISHNLAGATVTLANGAGYSQTITIPARSEDGQCINAWRDARADANRTSGSWTLTISGNSTNVAIGELILASNLRELPWQWDGEWEDEHLTTDPKKTFLGSTIEVDKGVRIRRAKGVVVDSTAADEILSLHRNGKGTIVPWLFIPKYDVNTAMYNAMMVKFVERKLVMKHQFDTYIPTTVAIEEKSMGLHLYPS